MYISWSAGDVLQSLKDNEEAQGKPITQSYYKSANVFTCSSNERWFIDVSGFTESMVSFDAQLGQLTDINMKIWWNFIK